MIFIEVYAISMQLILVMFSVSIFLKFIFSFRGIMDNFSWFDMTLCSSFMQIMIIVFLDVLPVFLSWVVGLY